MLMQAFHVLQQRFRCHLRIAICCGPRSGYPYGMSLDDYHRRIERLRSARDRYRTAWRTSEETGSTAKPYEMLPWTRRSWRTRCVVSTANLSVWKLTHLRRRRSSVMSRNKMAMKVLSERNLKRSFCCLSTKFHDLRWLIRECIAGCRMGASGENPCVFDYFGTAECMRARTGARGPSLFYGTTGLCRAALHSMVP